MIGLSQAVDDYLAIRRALGYKLIEHGRVLPQFVEFLGQREAQLITTALALEFAMQPAQASVVWWHQRLAIVRGFARYVQVSTLGMRCRRPTCCRPSSAARSLPVPGFRRSEAHECPKKGA
jgi:hypothetical protein